MNASLAPKEGKPLYSLLMQKLLKKMASSMKPDERLPAEREISLQYGVSRATVRQALAALERMGRIYRVQGRGTFVSPQKVHQGLPGFYSFSTAMKKLGKTPLSLVLSFSEREAEEYLAEKLKVHPGLPIYQILRLRLADNEPMLLETSYLPVDRFPGLTKQALEESTMYRLFRSRYGVEINHAIEAFQSVQTDARTAQYLGMSRAVPSLRIERFTYERGRIIEYTESFARGDQFVYTVRLEPSAKEEFS